MKISILIALIIIIAMKRNRMCITCIELRKFGIQGNPKMTKYHEEMLKKEKLQFDKELKEQEALDSKRRVAIAKYLEHRFTNTGVLRDFYSRF